MEDLEVSRDVLGTIHDACDETETCVAVVEQFTEPDGLLEGSRVVLAGRLVPCGVAWRWLDQATPRA